LCSQFSNLPDPSPQFCACQICSAVHGNEFYSGWHSVSASLEGQSPTASSPRVRR
jgi:hypothetical protein